MCNIKCSVATVIAGCLLVVGGFVVAFVVVPNVVENMIVNEVALMNNTIQLERFEDIPIALNFSVRFMAISNADGVLQGDVPIITEVGPYVYRLYQNRNITALEGDLVRYHLLEHFEFDAQASFPHTEDDLVTVINVPYHAIIQIAEWRFSSLMPILSLVMGDIFGEHNSPVMTARVRDLLFDGIPICKSIGIGLASIACGVIRDIGATAQNLAEQEDGSILFSVLAYKDGIPSEEYEVYRGIDDHTRLGHIRQFAGRDHFLFWDEENSRSICNMINGTDSMIYAPFVDRQKSLYAINMDICRSVELRYQYDQDIDGIPTLRFTANEWFLDNHEGCFCLNVTAGINREDGCLLSGVMELYSCVGAMMVLSYPHFLYADSRYRNSVLGMAPDEALHRIYVDIEPNTGTPIAGAKRAQFNIFQRPVNGINPTRQLRTALTPVVWVEEGFNLPNEFKTELRERLLAPLGLLDILLPCALALCLLVLVVGLLCVLRIKLAKPAPAPTELGHGENKQ